MSHEEYGFGISKESQLHIRAAAALGALRDLSGPNKPTTASLAETEEVDAQHRRVISEIIEEFGVDYREAIVIFAEKLALSKTEGENNGQDF